MEGKRILLIGRSGAGKTTLTQALQGKDITYSKTQSIKYGTQIIDSPGEYAEQSHLGYALALYAYEADIVGILCSSEEQYSLYPPNITSLTNRETIGIVTKCQSKKAKPQRAGSWLKLTGVKKLFYIDSVTGYGISELKDYLGF